MSSNYDLSTLINVLKTDSKELIHTKLELLKFDACQKASNIGSSLLFGLIVINLAFFVLLFAFVALGFWISDLLDSYAGGFGVIALVYLIFAIGIILCRKSILQAFRDFFSKELDPKLQNEFGFQLESARCRIRSKELTAKLEENLDYLQQNAGTLLGNSAVNAVTSKVSPFIQDLLGSGVNKFVTKLILRQLRKMLS